MCTYVNSGTAIADTFLPPLLSLWKMNCLTSISLFPQSTPSFLFVTPSFLFAISSLLSVTISCREDNPYCESCYSRTFGVTCASCNKLITGRGLQVASMLSLCTHRMYVRIYCTYIHTYIGVHVYVHVSVHMCAYVIVRTSVNAYSLYIYCYSKHAMCLCVHECVLWLTML